MNPTFKINSETRPWMNMHVGSILTDGTYNNYKPQTPMKTNPIKIYDRACLTKDDR